jgi:hypothetical protein
MEDDLVDYDSDPYKLAMRDQLEAADDSVFRVECHSRDPNTPQVEVCFLLFPLYYIRLLFFFQFRFPLLPFGCFHNMPYIYHFNDEYSSSPRVGSVDVPTPSILSSCLIVYSCNIQRTNIGIVTYFHYTNTTHCRASHFASVVFSLHYSISPKYLRVYIVRWP